MNNFLRDDPIITISTGSREKTAIGMIRISGFSDLQLFSSFSNLSPLKIVPRKAHLTRFSGKERELLDEGILVFYPAPNSYTGEDLIELHLHGNPLHLEKILRFLVLTFNLKRAHGGEFTYRALRNKKLSLSQVEGLDLLLNANSAIGIQAGLSSLSGELHSSYIELKNIFLELSSAIELAIDFSEDVGEEFSLEQIMIKEKKLKSLINKLYKGCSGNLNPMLTPSIVFYGETNAGKSTIFNKIIGNERAIVSDIEGTTRDFISEYFYIDETPFRLVDTAGFRSTEDKIEKIGIEKTKKLIEEAFVSVYICNPFNQKDKSFYDRVNNFDFIIFTHADCDGFSKKIVTFRDFLSGKKCFQSSILGPIEPLLGISDINGPIGPNSGLSNGPMGPLMKAININYLDVISKNMISIERHRELICEIHSQLEGLDLSSNINELAIVSADVYLLKRPIEELIGVVSADDILNNIFSNFCIGKWYLQALN